MEYLTAYYRRQEESGCSLLLQQYLCGHVPVCFACLCTAEGEESGGICRNMTERLFDWSRKVPWHRATARPVPWLNRLEGELTDLLEECRAAAACHEIRLTLFLGIEEEILVLGGGQNLSLLSTSFGRGKAAGLSGQFRGCLEPGAGLLLATDGFLKNVGKNLEEALRLQEIKTAEQAERRLRELAVPYGRTIPFEIAQRDRFSGGEPAAAILLVGR